MILCLRASRLAPEGHALVPNAFYEPYCAPPRAPNNHSPSRPGPSLAANRARRVPRLRLANLLGAHSAPLLPPVTLLG